MSDQQLDIQFDQEDPIFTYSAVCPSSFTLLRGDINRWQAISRLAGAAFVGVCHNIPTFNSLTPALTNF